MTPFSTCTQENQYEVIVHTQYLEDFSFDVATNQLQVTTVNNSSTWTEGSDPTPITCATASYSYYAGVSESDETDAYITITGSKL